MQIVEFESGVHPVNNGVFVDEPREFSHNLLNQCSGIAEVVHDVAARSDLVSPVHTVVESGNTVDVMNFVNSHFFMNMRDFFVDDPDRFIFRGISLLLIGLNQCELLK